MTSRKILFVSRHWNQHAENLAKCLREQGHAVSITIVPQQPDQTYDTPITDRQAKQALIDTENIEVIIADYQWLTPVFRHTPRRVKTLLLLHDARTLLLKGFEDAGYRHHHYPWDRDKELESLKHVDAILTCCVDDKNLMAYDYELPVMEIGIQRDIVKHSLTEQIIGRCLYVGSDVGENRLSLTWFIEKVWPLVLKEVPEAWLDVCGTRLGRLYKNVTQNGHVPDLNPFYAMAQCCVIPHISHGGIKLRTTEAMAHGKALVSSPCGLDGITSYPVHFFSGEACGPEEGVTLFARDVIKTLTDHDYRHDAEDTSLLTTENDFTAEAAYGTLFQYLQHNV